MNERVRRRSFGKWVFLLALIGIGVFVFWNREWIYDYYKGVSYQPSSEMERIRGDLGLTEQGEFRFNAAQPKLSEREEFNAVCRGSDTEIAVLGCYTNGEIYVYNITDEQLAGIRELTTAHELLHAVWARMSDVEKSALEGALAQVLEENRGFLAEELDAYEESERQEELYVRAGTEVKALPEQLEVHYGAIFKDQDKVVEFYDSYIGVFRRLEEELDALALKMEGLSGDIEQRTSKYETAVAQLNADIVSFNSCAKVVGCFASEEEFYVERAELISRQDGLEAEYNEISGLIDEYNVMVEQYNADVLRSEKLNNIINSAARPAELE